MLGGGVGVGVGVGIGQFREVGENVIGMVLNRTKVAEPEKLLIPVRNPSGCVIQPLAIPLLGALKVIDMLMVVAVPNIGVTIIW
jgi:hypothetical protein